MQTPDQHIWPFSDPRGRQATNTSGGNKGKGVTRLNSKSVKTAGNQDDGEKEEEGEGAKEGAQNGN